MSEAGSAEVLKHLTFGDIKFLNDFFATLPGARSLKGVATKLGFKDPANLHHRLRRALSHIAFKGPLHHGTRLTPEGEALAGRIRELWRRSKPLLPLHGGAVGRLPVRLALPEVITGRSFAELVRQLHDQPWGDELELETRRLSPQKLKRALIAGPDDLVLTISGSPDLTSEVREPARRRGGVVALRRVLLCLNNDPLGRENRPGASGVSDDKLRGRSLYLPPDELWPGFDFPRFDRLCDVHSVSSFAEAHAHALAGRGALAAAHPELIDEVEDKLCTTLLLGPEAGQTVLELHRPTRGGARARERGPRADLIRNVFDMVAKHLEELRDRTARADATNRRLARLRCIAHTSNAPAGARAGPVPWHWRHSRLEWFHVTALGHLKGRHAADDRPDESFDIFGRMMHRCIGDDSRRQHHALWRSVDHKTCPGDAEPREEHFSVNLIFVDEELDRDRTLVGLWSGRRSGPGAWEPGCGVIVLTEERRSDDELNAILHRFQGRLHHWQEPALAANGAGAGGLTPVGGDEKEAR